jgi:hypothetical protein
LYTKPYRLHPSAFAISSSPTKETTVFLLRFCQFRVEEVKILLLANWPACPVRRLLKLQAESAFTRLILTTLLNQCLLRNTSVNLAPNNLKDQDCKKEKITVRPPNGYAQFKYKQCVTAPQSIKLKLLEGNQFSCNLMDDSSNSETYLKWLLVFIHIKEEKKLDSTLEVAAEALTKVQEDSKVPKRESVKSKSERTLELVAANTRLVEAKVEHGSTIGAC